MPKTAGQGVKPFILWRILSERTDEDHKLSAEEICSIMIDEYGISAERKSIYRYMDVLDEAGISVEHDDGGYFICERTFQKAELKLLADVVQSSRFITEKKSRELIGKFESILSVHEAKEIRRQVYVANRIKTMNESIYYNVDGIHTALAKRRRITFRYFDWNEKKEHVCRHGCKLYLVEPLALLWEDENYYLVAHDVYADKVKHYRVDKMEGITVTEMQSESNEPDDDMISGYTNRHFGMFGGKETLVVLKCKNEFAGVIIDRFGKDVPFRPAGEGWFSISVKVAVSVHFFTWIMNFRGGVMLKSPDNVCEEFREFIREANIIYME